jgi:hypothetical protein
MKSITRSTLFTCVVLVVAVILSEAGLNAQSSDPRYTSWLTSPSGTYARLYESTSDLTAGNSVTTWTRGQGTQSTPTYAGVTAVSYSIDWVYILSSGLGYHVMGPWYLNEAKTNNFPNFPANTDVLYRIPRNPTVPANKTATGGGAVGYFVDGIAMFDNRDTFSYINSSASDGSPMGGGRGDGVWNRDAYVNEGVTFDPALAHQAGAQYHYHANAPALRYQLQDHVDYDSSTRTYSEKSGTPSHSPIVAWVADGYPVYGPYGYSDPNNASSTVRRMISGYIKRDGTSGSTNLNTTGRTTLPTWAVEAQGIGPALSSGQTGPNVSTAYPLGHYLEDYDYLGDLGQTLGTDFDLDKYNGRFCVTPDFPSGTYAYFLSIESDGTPKYPYTMGRWYYGNPTGDSVNSISETVTQQIQGAPSATLIVSATADGASVEIGWNSVEGATYQVESSADGSAWTTVANSVSSSGLTTTLTSAEANQYRVTLTSISSYDTDGTTGTAVGSTGTVVWSSPSTDTAPTITAQPTAMSVDVGSSANFSVTATGTDPLAFQWSQDGVNVSGATNASYTIASATTTDAGNYTVTITNSLGSITSSAANLTVNPVTNPDPDPDPEPDPDPDPATNTTRIANLSTRTKVGGEAGTPVIGLVVAGTGSKSLIARAVGPTLGDYGVTGFLTDPELKLQRSSDNVAVAYNDNWHLAPNRDALVAKSTPVGAFALTANSADAAWFGSLPAGGYTAPVLDDRGEGIVLLEVYDAGTASDTAQLSNASTRAWVGTDDSILITGFVLAGTESRQVLLRAVGPTLADFGVTGVLSDPTASLYSGGTLLQTNDNWSTASNTAAITSAAATAGAFTIPSGSADSALLVDLAPGAYTLQVSGVGATTGTALVEIYLLD